MSFPHNDIIDSRELVDLQNEVTNAIDDWNNGDTDALDEYGSLHDAHEFKKQLDELESEISEWSDGNTLIAEDYFQTYAQELAEDCGMLPDGLNWPLTCIDWSMAARELAYDYSLIDIDGRGYYVRSC